MATKKRDNIQFQLAYNYKEQKKNKETGEFVNKYSEKDLPKFAGLEPKYDGLRGVLEINKDVKSIGLTRTGLPVFNVDHILNELDIIKPLYNHVLDGEYFAGTWNLTNSIVKKRTLHPEYNKLHIYIFDILSQFDWEREQNDIPLKQRQNHLKEIFSDYSSKLKYVHLVESTVCNDINKGIVVNKYVDDKVKQGYEGCMIKDLNAPYMFKKHKSWWKMKLMQEADFEITDALEGEDGFVGILGKVVVKGKVNGINIVSEVGSGFDIADRKMFWDMHKKGKLVGNIIEVKYQSISINDSLLYPIFRRFRWDKKIVG